MKDDPGALREMGMEHAQQMCERLLDEGAPGIHFITFNQSTATREIYERIAADRVPAMAAGRP